jgi:hypothetical protein
MESGWQKFVGGDWLVTRWAARIFLIAVIVFFGSFPVLVGWIGVDPTPTSVWTHVYGAVGTFGVTAGLVLWAGMWKYWARQDSSRPAVKRFWFFVLLLGLWCLSWLYWLCVYRPQVSRILREQP